MSNDIASGNASSPAASPAAGGGGGAAPGKQTLGEGPAQAIASKGSGAPLRGDVASHLGGSFGASLGDVRVHNDASANKAADKAGAEAFTYGNDIFFGSGKYQPDTDHGAFVLSHEVAHTVQEGGAVKALQSDAGAQHSIEEGADNDPAEADASAAASTALAGGTYSPTKGPGRIRYFKQGSGQASDGGHAFMTEQALRGMGLNDQQARQGRMGNWERDLSQVRIPTTQKLHLIEPIMPILNILAIKDFGRTINLGEFGGYDPVEHIDNPTDLRADGAYNQGPMQQVGQLDADQHQADGQQTNPAAAGDNGAQAWADVDPRYAETQRRLAAAGHHFRPGETNAAYQVDETGIPVYVNTSKELLKVQLKNAMRIGRIGNDGRGPRLFSSAVHILQDFYAHSNFSEIAINILLREGNVQVATGEHDAAGHAVMQSIGLQQTHNQVLNTGMHGLGADGNTAMSANLENNGREVLTTGSFNLTDTIASVLEEVSDRWKQYNPFKRDSREPSELIAATLDYIERGDSPTEFNGIGARLAGLIDGAIPAIETIAPTAANIVEGAGHAAGTATRFGGRVASGGFGVLNRINSAFGGDADYFSDQQHAVTNAANNAAGSVEGATGQAAEGVRNVVSGMHRLSASVRDQSHLLRTGYEWVYNNVNPFQWLVDASRHIPVYGDRIAAHLLTLKDDFLRLLERTFGVMWNRIIDKGVEKINKVISSVRAATNVSNQRTAGAGGGLRNFVARTLGGVGDMYHRDPNGRLEPNNGIAPRTYQPPSHTEIAKDHDELSEGATDHAPDAGPQSHQEEHDHADGDHGHVHVGAWLAPIAEGMAQAATYAVGNVVNAGWNDVAAAARAGGSPDGSNFRAGANGGPQEYPWANSAAHLDPRIDQIVDEWFAHPADIRNHWEGFVRNQLQQGNMGPELLHRLGVQLAGAHPGTPAAPSEQQGTAIVQPTAPAGHTARDHGHAAAPGQDAYDQDPTQYGEHAREPGHRDDHLHVGQGQGQATG